MTPDFLETMKGTARSCARGLSRLLPAADLSAFTARPYELFLELTNLCNAKCVFCSYTLQEREHSFMPEHLFKKTVADYVALGGGSVGLTPVVGDPLLHPKFVEWVRYLRSVPAIDSITVTTNGILLNKHGVDAVLDCGLSCIHISTAGFDEEMYRRIYRSDSYRSFRDGVYRLLAANARRAHPIPIFLLFRPDRPVKEVMAQPDLQPLLQFKPRISFCTTFSRLGGQINQLPNGMSLEPPVLRAKSEPCFRTWWVAMVLATGDVQVCNCEPSMNARQHLVVGNILRESLGSIWQGETLRRVRDSFQNGTLNPTCQKCDLYAPLQLRSREARVRAKISKERQGGKIIHRGRPFAFPFQFE